MRLLSTTLNLALVSLLLLNVFAGNDKSTITDSRTWQKSFTVNADADFALSSRESDVRITTWDENRVEVKVTLSVEAYDQEELDKMLRLFEPKILGNAQQVTIEQPSAMQEVVTGNRTRIKINNEVIKVKSYHYSFEIKMPRLNNIDSKNKFSVVTLGNHKGRVNLELYECQLTAGEVDAIETTASIKFSKGALGSARTMTLNTYETALDMRQVRLLTMDAKFSTINFEKLREATITAYESDLNLGVTHTLTINQNFGKLKLTEAQSVTLTSYELQFDAGFISEFKLPSAKFSVINCGKAGPLQVATAYESDFTLGEVASLTMDARFCSVDIDKLSDFMEVTSYQTNLKINEIAPTFSRLRLNGKFTKAQLHLLDDPGYHLSADLNFGRVELPENSLRGMKVEHEGNRFRAAGSTSGYSGTARIDITGFQTTVVLEQGG